jgi:DNA invertase Pin-like site-specific DNA recombinase
MRIGHSYTRYSAPSQSEGDSVRRQTTITREWCKRNDVVLDDSRNYLDRGKSAYHGRHRKDGGALKAFLDDIDRGDIQSGSVLIIENLDRLSRENPWDAVPLLCNIINRGITVVTLTPGETIYERGSNMTALIMAVVEFTRGHSESKTKANRMGEVWAEKRRAVREKRTILTKQLPAWIAVHEGKLVTVPSRVRLIRRMFELTIKGYGLSLIVRDLTKNNEPVWGRSENGWSKMYVRKILSGRTVLGEYQPISHNKPDGEPIPDYYPSIVDEATWIKAQAAMQRRTDKPGRIGPKVGTPFSGLLRDAATGDRLRISWQTRGPKGKRVKRRVLVPSGSMEGKVPAISFPFDVFEPAILALLKEINPADVLGQKAESKSFALGSELAGKEQRVRLIEDEIATGGDIPALTRILRRLSEECDGLRKDLAVARQEESGSATVAWAEAMTLIDAAKTEGARLRLREQLRIMIEEIVVLVVPRRSHRLAAVQIFFRGGRRRDYLVHYWAAGHGRKGGWRARSLPGEIRPKDLDLRRKGDVQKLAKTLGKIDLKELAK